MFLIGLYSYKRELKGVIIDLNCLKELVLISQGHNMSYNITIEYKTGETFYNIAIEDIESDVSLQKRILKGVTFTAKNSFSRIIIAVGAESLNEVEIESDKKDEFSQLKQELQEWQNLYKNKNPFIIFAPFIGKSELYRVIMSALLSFCTILPLMIVDWRNGVSFDVMDAITVLFYIGMLYYIVTLGISAIFLHSVEIDIGNNWLKTRRKIANWVLTVLIIPVIISWIFAFI